MLDTNARWPCVCPSHHLKYNLFSMIRPRKSCKMNQTYSR
jgi:hypothetical protein